MHDEKDIEASATGLWFDVFREHVLRGPITVLHAAAYRPADAMPEPPPETPQQCVDRCAALADAAEAKCRERLARAPRVETSLGLKGTLADPNGIPVDGMRT